ASTNALLTLRRTGSKTSIRKITRCSFSVGSRRTVAISGSSQRCFSSGAFIASSHFQCSISLLIRSPFGRRSSSASWRIIATDQAATVFDDSDVHELGRMSPQAVLGGLLLFRACRTDGSAVGQCCSSSDPGEVHRPRDELSRANDRAQMLPGGREGPRRIDAP